MRSAGARERIISWANGAHVVSIRDVEDEYFEVTVTSSSAQFITRLNKIADDFTCERQ